MKSKTPASVAFPPKPSPWFHGSGNTWWLFIVPENIMHNALTWYIKIRNLGFFSYGEAGDEKKKKQNSRSCGKWGLWKSWNLRTYAKVCFYGRSGNEAVPERRACSLTLSVVLTAKGCSQLWKTLRCSNSTLHLKEEFWSWDIHKIRNPNLCAHVVINIVIPLLFLATFYKNDINTKKQRQDIFTVRNNYGLLSN